MTDDANTRFMDRQVKLIQRARQTANDSDLRREFGISKDRVKLMEQRARAKQTNL